ncbi:MAG: IclR family transcriptional regulator [Microbacteriaceae bacterium]
MTSSEDQPTRVVRSVQHAAGIMRALGASSDSMSMSELARRVSLSKPATYHLLKTLELERFVVKDSGSRYRLSWGVYELGSSVIRSVDLARVARPHVDDLAVAVGEVVLVGILDEGTVLYLDRAASADATDMLAGAGRRTAMHATASGKLLLAYQSEDAIQSIIDAGLPARTTATAHDPAALKKELDAIRVNGYATCWQEFDVSLSSIAAPLIDYTGATVAALTIAGSSTSITPQSLPKLLALLQPAAEAISAELGAPAVLRVIR